MSSLPKKLVFIDCETTGCGARDRIIDLGIIRVEEGQIVSTFDSLINPNCYISPEITSLTGINPAQLENAPTFGQVKKDVLDILKDAVFVAHNVRFDYNFLRKEFSREEIHFRSKQICTVKLSRTLFPTTRHHNLDSIIERFGFEIKNRHRAFDDAKVLWDFYQYLEKNFSIELLEKAVNFVLKQPTRPINIAPDILDNLPEKSGVYIFYGQSGNSLISDKMPLYIGKSVNVRDRVLSHFSSDKDSPTEAKIAQQVESIEVIDTAGELGALFKEAQLIKKMQPLYNRMLRYSRAMMVLKRQVKNGYDSVEIDTADTIDPDNLEVVLGVFKNKKSVKDLLIFLAKEYGLCEKLLGIESTLTTECFGYRLKRCKGGCVGKEPPVLYNMRFAEAFAKTKLKPWPFNGPIIIEEKDELSGRSEGFLVDKWCYLGTLSDNGSFIDKKIEKEFNFDVDTYKILMRYILNPKNRKHIKEFKRSFQENLTLENDLYLELSM